MICTLVLMPLPVCAVLQSLCVKLTALLLLLSQGTIGRRVLQPGLSGLMTGVDGRGVVVCRSVVSAIASCILIAVSSGCTVVSIVILLDELSECVWLLGLRL